MASVVDPSSGLPVLELGPGTGIITKAILARGVAPENLASIEYSTPFYQHLKNTIPGVHFINGDAFDLDRTLGDWKDRKFDAVVSAIPLLSFPMERRIAMLEDLLDPLPPGRPVVQIPYSPVSPIDARARTHAVQGKRVAARLSLGG